VLDPKPYSVSLDMVNPQEKISVALCTYNGKRFLARQLASIQQQTISPFELVVCDDCSTDGTLQIVREFAASASFPVRLARNEDNIGFVANFERAIGLCEGDLIALSDQDDIWYPTRLERSQQEFAAHPEAGLVFSDADVMNDQDELTGTRLWTNYGFAGERKQRLLQGDYTVLVGPRFVTGATVMFRSRLRANCLPVGSGWLHDEWIVANVAAVAELRAIEAPLIRYRQHASQQVGLGPRLSRWERYKKHWNDVFRQIGLLEEICQKISQQSLSRRGEALYACYQAHLQFARFRHALPRGRLARLPSILKRYPSYAACASGVLSMATDIALKK
jgi:glycosyltransferase involved in cell wall biosynthesis